MKFRKCFGVRLIVLAASMLLMSSLAPARAELTDAQIQQAIVTLKAHLYAEQRANGSWDPDNPDPDSFELRHHGGRTCMATLALLYAGESFQSENGPNGGVKRALAWIATKQDRDELWGTYTYGVLAHIWAALPQQFEGQLESSAEYLANAHNRGLYGYQEYNAGGRVDHSVTQYGVLGLWEYAKRDGRVSGDFWRLLTAHYLSWQNPDGGWNYGDHGRNERSYGSMTASGLTVLYVAQQELYRDRPQANSEIQAGIAKGLDWFNQYFNETGNISADPEVNKRRHPYYWYGIERVALASGISNFNGMDWYRTGAESLITQLLVQNLSRVRANQRIVDVSFALMFLTRGRVPVWCNKIGVEGSAWNNRPNDVYFLTHYISDLYEREVNWQVVSLDDDPAETWLRAPISWLSSNQNVNLTGVRGTTLRRYLDLGGTLVVNSEGRRGLDESIRSFVAQQYPGLEFERAEPDHPLLTMIHKVDCRESERPMVLSNGARDLIVLLPGDWGMEFQRDERQEGIEWEIFSNLYAAYTDRGAIEPRLVERYVASPSTTTSSIRVIRGVVGDPSGSPWNLEADGWSMFRGHFSLATGKSLDVQTVALEDVGTSDAALLHLAGVSGATMTPTQIEAIRAFVDGGGTVLVETLGGNGQLTDDGLSKFSLEVRNQLRSAWDADVVPAGSTAVIRGRGLGDGSADTSRAVWRRYSRLRFNFGFDNRVEALIFADRSDPRVFISHEDLTLGSIDCRHAWINGYQTATARQILTNLLLASDRNRNAATAAAATGG